MEMCTLEKYWRALLIAAILVMEEAGILKPTGLSTRAGGSMGIGMAADVTSTWRTRQSTRATGSKMRWTAMAPTSGRMAAATWDNSKAV